MAEVQLQTQYNRCSIEIQQEQVDINKPSMTVPGQAFTAAEVIDRMTKGLSLSDMKVPEYNGDDAVFAGVNWDNLDISELADMRDDYVEKARVIRDEYNKKMLEENEQRRAAFEAWEKEQVKKFEEEKTGKPAE